MAGTTEEEATDLLRKFTDEGDLILGHSLETSHGRGTYEEIRRRVFKSLEDDGLAVGKLRIPDGGNFKILILKMVEKAITDWIREQLR